MRDRSSFEREVADRVGMLPNFFRSAPEAPELLERLWAFAKAAYLDNPLPPVFKERLFVYLSRFCPARYCLVRHVGFLIGKGRPSGDPGATPHGLEEVTRLLRRPVPSIDELPEILARLEALPAPLGAWPLPESSEEDTLLVASTFLFLEPARSQAALPALRRTLGPLLEYLLGFMGFIRTAHYWTLTHPALAFEEDMQDLMRGEDELRCLLLDDPEADRSDPRVRLHDEIALLREERTTQARVDHALKNAFERVVGGASLSAGLDVLVHSAREVLAAGSGVFILWPGQRRLRKAAVVGLSESQVRAIETFPIDLESLSSGGALPGTEDEHGNRTCWSFPIRETPGALLGAFVMCDPHVRDPEPRHLEAGRALAEVARLLIDRHQIEEQRRAAEAELKEADQRKDEFLAVLAHELRNPLAPMRNALEILRRAPSNVAVVEQSRAMIDRQLGHLVRLVDDLLEVSRITRGTLEVRRERLELSTVVAAALETSRHLMEECRHELSVSLPDESLHVNGDATRLSQVLSNLLHNAAKYTPPGGRVTLDVRREADEAVLRVTDTGVGVPREMLAKIFEMFHQVEPSMGYSQGGLGVGLTLVKRLVEMHGGSISARSEGPGTGSEFIVRLPLVDDGAKATPDEVRPARAASSVRARRILVVDDNADSARSLADLLALEGHRVEVAHDGEAALRTARRFVPEVILLDLGLPGMDGYEVAKRIRMDAKLNHALLIAQTGWGRYR